LILIEFFKSGYQSVFDISIFHSQYEFINHSYYFFSILFPSISFPPMIILYVFIFLLSFNYLLFLFQNLIDFPYFIHLHHLKKGFYFYLIIFSLEFYKKEFQIIQVIICFHFDHFDLHFYVWFHHFHFKYAALNFSFHLIFYWSLFIFHFMYYFIQLCSHFILITLSR